MNDSGNISQHCQQDVDEEIGPAATLKEDTKRWEDNSNDDLADIAVR